MPQAEQLTDPVAQHGEGPVWSDSWGGLRFVDMTAGYVLSLSAEGQVSRQHVGSVAAALRPRTAGGYVIALERGFGLADDVTAPPRPLDELWSDTGIRFNEGGCDPDGRFYCGSMAYDESPGSGRMFRLDPDGSTRVVLTDVTISNGLEWSPDGSLAYYNDTPTQQVDVFDYDTERGLHGRRKFVAIDETTGSGDGLTVDAEGGVWVALWSGGAVHRYRPDGALDLVIEVSASQVTACTFGGPLLDQLFITTSREGLADCAEPAAGAVFGYTPGVCGYPTRPFAG